MTVTKSVYPRREREFYETEAWAVDALLRCFPVFRGWPILWEPAAGGHAIVRALRELRPPEDAIVRLIASDIADYGAPHDFLHDFLEDHKPWQAPFYAGIVTNPPYGPRNRLAEKFARRALDLASGPVAMLTTAKFDFGSTRVDLFRDCPRYLGRVALIDRISWTGDGRTGTEDHAWHVWAPAASRPQPPVMFWEGRQSADPDERRE